jgi:hypothetical protein
MRAKSYYTVAETELNLYTSGSQYMREDETEYVGLYHKYIITDEIYTLASWNPNKSKKLIPYKPINPMVSTFQKLHPGIKTEYKIPQPTRPEISLKDRKAGFVNRYFIQKVNSLKIIEFNKYQFDDYNNKKLDPNMYRVAQIKWTITGPLLDSNESGIYIQSIQTKNQESIDQIKKTIPGITSLLSNLTQYYSDTDFTVPKDINPTSL